MTTDKVKLTTLSLTRAELEALLYAATNRDPLVGVNNAAGESATAKLQKALEK
jgi:hypothetical protein